MFTELRKPRALQGSPVVFGWLGEPSGERIGWRGTPNAPSTSRRRGAGKAHHHWWLPGL